MVKENYAVAQPAFELQKVIRRNVLGVKYWEKKAKQRTKTFATYDQVCLEACKGPNMLCAAPALSPGGLPRRPHRKDETGRSIRPRK